MKQKPRDYPMRHFICTSKDSLTFRDELVYLREALGEMLELTDDELASSPAQRLISQLQRKWQPK